MTSRQQQLLAFLRERETAGLIPPNYREMAAHLGLGSRGNIHRLVKGLAKAGYIEHHPNCARSCRVVERDRYAEGYAAGYAACLARVQGQARAA